MYTALSGVWGTKPKAMLAFSDCFISIIASETDEASVIIFWIHLVSLAYLAYKTWS